MQIIYLALFSLLVCPCMAFADSSSDNNRETVPLRTLDQKLKIALENAPLKRLNTATLQDGTYAAYRLSINEEGLTSDIEPLKGTDEKVSQYWRSYIESTRFTKPRVMKQEVNLTVCFGFYLRSTDPELWEWRIWDPNEIDDFPEAKLTDSLLALGKMKPNQGAFSIFYDKYADKPQIEDFTIYSNRGGHLTLKNNDYIILTGDALQKSRPVNHQEHILFNNVSENAWRIGIRRYAYKWEESYWEVVKSMELAYPPYYARNEIEGKGVLRILIDNNGDVISAAVDSATTPIFGKVAREGAYNYKFKYTDAGPAPKSTLLYAPFRFFIYGGSNARPAFSFPNKKYLQYWPDYNELPDFSNVEEPLYPYSHLLTHKKGKATVEVHVNEKGYPTYLNLLSASSDDFGMASLAAMQRYRFKPAKMDGVPVPFMFKWTFNFSTGDLITSEYKLLQKLRKNKLAIVPYSDLDTKPEVLFSTRMQLPKITNLDITEGSAKIRFIINDHGHVLFPEILECTHPAIGYAAAQAVLKWDFTPGKKDGKPVITMAVQPFSL